MTQPNFHIKNRGLASEAFLAAGIHDFVHAEAFIKGLPYRRNARKDDLLSLFSEGCGTCSTKHALLKQLASENSFKGLELMLGIFRMNGRNTPAVAQTLNRHGLECIPEAHNYLRFGKLTIDCTQGASKPENFLPDLIEEHPITPSQITDYKVNYHKKFLRAWLELHPEIFYSLETLWDIREQCIRDLSTK